MIQHIHISEKSEKCNNSLMQFCGLNCIYLKKKKKKIEKRCIQDLTQGTTECDIIWK